MCLDVPAYFYDLFLVVLMDLRIHDCSWHRIARRGEGRALQGLPGRRSPGPQSPSRRAGLCLRARVLEILLPCNLQPISSCPFPANDDGPVAWLVMDLRPLTWSNADTARPGQTPRQPLQSLAYEDGRGTWPIMHPCLLIRLNDPIDIGKYTACHDHHSSISLQLTRSIRGMAHHGPSC